MTHILASLAIPFAARSLPERMTLVVHITAGSLSIILGFVALAVAKGAPLHRRVGIFFVYAMLVMSLLGATTAALWSRAAFINVPAGLLTAYLVTTALITVRPPFARSRQVGLALTIVALTVGLYNLTFGVKAVMRADGRMFGFPPFPFFMFAAIGLLSSAGDFRIVRSGALQGAPRLARHLWRMTFALFIATASFFLGQAKVIPKPYRIFPLLAIPPLAVVVALLYWLWRVRFKRSLRGITGAAIEPLLKGPRATIPRVGLPTV